MFPTSTLPAPVATVVAVAAGVGVVDGGGGGGTDTDTLLPLGRVEADGISDPVLIVVAVVATVALPVAVPFAVPLLPPTTGATSPGCNAFAASHVVNVDPPSSVPTPFTSARCRVWNTLAAATGSVAQKVTVSLNMVAAPLQTGVAVLAS